MNVVELLTAARALIVRGWCQGTYARNAEGRPTPYGGPAACAWCMSGAVREATVATDVNDDTRRAVYRLLKTATGGCAIPLWNDEPTRSKDDVLEVFDVSIKLAREEGLDKPEGIG